MAGQRMSAMAQTIGAASIILVGAVVIFGYSWVFGLGIACAGCALLASANRTREDGKLYRQFRAMRAGDLPP